jgi:hypothetical protein
MCGRSNVIYWLNARGYTPQQELVDLIFEHAKESASILEEADVLALCIDAGATLKRV